MDIDLEATKESLISERNILREMDLFKYFKHIHNYQILDNIKKYMQNIDLTSVEYSFVKNYLRKDISLSDQEMFRQRIEEYHETARNRIASEINDLKKVYQKKEDYDLYEYASKFIFQLEKVRYLEKQIAIKFGLRIIEDEGGKLYFEQVIR